MELSVPGYLIFILFLIIPVFLFWEFFIGYRCKSLIYLQMFPPVNNLSFHFLNGQCLLSKRRHFQFQRSLIYQVFFSFMKCTFSFISKKSLPSSRSQRRTPMFASRFIVSDCKCISMSYFWVNLCTWYGSGFFFSPLCINTCSSTVSWEKT